MREWLVAYAAVPSFYAWVERVDDPALRGRPVIVGGRPSKRGKVQSASEDAMEAGVRHGMPVEQALELCPDAALVPTNMKRYREVSSLFHSCLRNVNPCKDAETCAVANVWREAQDALTGALDRTNLADVI